MDGLSGRVKARRRPTTTAVNKIRESVSRPGLADAQASCWLTSEGAEDCEEQAPGVDHVLVDPEAAVRDEPGWHTRADARDPPQWSDNELLVMSKVLV